MRSKLSFKTFLKEKYLGNFLIYLVYCLELEAFKNLSPLYDIFLIVIDIFSFVTFFNNLLDRI